MGPFILPSSWLSGPRIDVMTEPPLICPDYIHTCMCLTPVSTWISNVIYVVVS